jgi:UDP-2,4-diacetamido-2,4,6-trideoxy-beta-L-altropyranose hydrolase
MAVIAFRADASLQIGTGHVMRCLTLADALREQGARCSFVGRPHKGHLLELIAQRGYQALALPELQEGARHDLSGTVHSHWLGTDWATDAKDTQHAISKMMGGEPLDWLVMDHYALDERWEEALRPQAKRIMVIDDLADRPHACDLLLDQNLGRKSEHYSDLLEGKAKTLIGPQYALLRPEFASLRKQSLARRQSEPELCRLLITMGGVDKHDATGNVLAALQGSSLPADVRVTVVMGPHAPSLLQVQAQATQMPWHTEVFVGVDNMAELMAKSDLAIGAVGGTAWERCSLGLPSVVLVLAKNQLPGAVALQKAGAAVVMETQQQIMSFIEPMQKVAFAKDVLAKMSMASAAVTDGEGCQRVAKYLLESAHD